MMKILILEDNEARRTAMADCLRDRFHQYGIEFFDAAAPMRAYLENNLAAALVICLDHDLELMPGDDGKLIDPGTGRDVADFLARHDPVCPVVIHTTNASAGDGMEFLLRDAHWQTHRVHPFGDLEWISSVWFRTVRNAIVGAAQPRTTNAS